MLRDLAALTPPLLAAAAFLIGLVAFLRHEMSAKRRRGAPEDEADYSGTSGNAETADRSAPRPVGGENSR